MKYIPALIPFLLPSIAQAAEIIETVSGPVDGTWDGVLLLDHTTATDGWITTNPFRYGGNGISLAEPGASGTYYFAFDWTVLDNAGEATSGSGFFGGLGFYHSGPSGLQVRSLAGNPWTGRFFGMGEVGNDVNSTVEYQVGTTARIVLQVTFVPNAPDSIVMYVNPPEGNPFAEGNPAGVTRIQVTDDWSFNTLLSRAGGGQASVANLVVAVPQLQNEKVATWKGGDGENWASATNWQNDTVPAEGDVLIFGDSINSLLTNNLPESFTAGGLLFRPDAVSYDIVGNSLSLTGPINNASLSHQYLNFPIALQQDLEVGTSSHIYLTDTISGPYGLTKTGSGYLELHGENTYAGTTTIGGILRLGDGIDRGSINPASLVTFASGNDHRLEFNRIDDFVFPNPIATGGRANFSTISAGRVTLDNAITGSGEFWTYGDIIVAPHPDSATRNSSNVVASGTLEISDFGPETLGTGNFYLSPRGAATLRYTGPTASTDRLGGWALQGFAAGNTLDVSRADTELTITSGLHGSDTSGLTKAGAGTLILEDEPAYSGDTVITEGVLSLQQRGLSDTASVRIDDGGKLDLAFEGSDTVSGLLLAGEVQSAGIYSEVTHPEFFSGPGSIEVLSSDLSATLVWDDGGTGNAWSAAQNWQPDRVPAAGDILAFAGSGGATSNDLASGMRLGGLIFPVGSGAFELGGNEISLSGAIQNSSENTQTIGVPLALASNLHISSIDSDLVLTQQIRGPFGITKTGTGRLELRADNTYTGTTAITGVLALGTGGTTGSLAGGGEVSFGTGSNNRLEINRSDDVTLANPINTGGRANIVAISGKVTVDQTITGSGEFWTSGHVQIVPNEGSAARNTSNVIVNGVLEIPSFGPDVLGNGNFFLAQGGTGALRYTGPGESTNRLGNWALQGTGTDAIIDVADPDATLLITSSIGDVGGNGLTKTGPGTLTLAATSNYNGGTVVEQGTLALQQPTLHDGHPVRVAAGAKLHLEFEGSDIVPSLILGEQTQNPGTYNASTHPAFFSGTGSIIVPGENSSPFLAWIGAFPALTNPAERAPHADPDGDGLSNLAEFALDGNPANPSANGKVRHSVDSGYLTLTLPVRQGAIFTGNGPLTAQLPADGVTYNIGGGPNLEGFTGEIIEVAPQASDLPALSSGWQYRSFRLATPVGDVPKGFLRAEISETP
jgi:autotransporter-associated beta strand protein